MSSAPYLSKAIFESLCLRLPIDRVDSMRLFTRDAETELTVFREDMTS
jgi:hypothetical protein